MACAGLLSRAPAQVADFAAAEQQATCGWTGDWGGARRFLLDRGVRLDVTQTTDLSWHMLGGVDPGRVLVRSLWDFEVDLDLERALSWSGSRVYADFQIQNGPDGSLDSGDFQVYSNIDSPDRQQLAQVYWEQSLAGGALRFRLGKMDANDEFALVENGTIHMHSSFGFAPTIVGFPSYPDPAFGAALFVDVPGPLYARAAVFDGATQAGRATGPRGPGTWFGSPSDEFGIAEVGLRGGQPAEPWRLAVGGFRHTGDFARRDGSPQRGATGFYANGECRLWHDGAGAAVDAFAQFGYVDPDVSIAPHYYGAGARFSGFVAQRPDDVFGFGVALARFRSDAGDGVRGGGEAAIEAFYRAQLTPSFSVMPDLQYIHDPGGQPGLDDVVVLTLRFVLAF